MKDLDRTGLLCNVIEYNSLGIKNELLGNPYMTKKGPIALNY